MSALQATHFIFENKKVIGYVKPAQFGNVDIFLDPTALGKEAGPKEFVASGLSAKFMLLDRGFCNVELVPSDEMVYDSVEQGLVDTVSKTFGVPKEFLMYGGVDNASDSLCDTIGYGCYHIKQDSVRLGLAAAAYLRRKSEILEEILRERHREYYCAPSAEKV